MGVAMTKVEEQQEIIRLLRGPQFDRNRHGSLYDRGRADSYYRRPRSPHWWPNGTGNGAPVISSQLTDAERAEYRAGYNHNEQFGDKKSYD